MADQTETEDSMKDHVSPDSDPAYDIETYRHAIQEARRTLDQQLKAFNDVNGKAWRIVQLNGIIATIYISAVANALGDLQLTLIPTGLLSLGLISMACSAYLAANGQDVRKVTIGQGTDAFESIRQTDPSEIEYLYKTLEDYEDWIEEVNRKSEQNGEIVNKSKWLLIGGVILITAGTILASVT